MLFVVVIGGAIALSPVSLAGPWPLPLVCLASLALGITMEIMMVQWTVALARNIPPRIQARVSSYDALGSVMAMPAGALVAGPIASVIGVSATQYGAAALIIGVSALALIPRDIRQMRAVPPTARPASPGPSDGDGRPVPDDVPALDDRPLPAAAGRARNRCPHAPAALPAGVRAENPSVADPCVAGPAAWRPG